MINIAGLTPVEDPSYRYKMPRIVPKVEGRGNGIKTVLVNVSDVATSLNRDPLEITKFFGFELGAQTTMIVEDDRYIVNGAHSVQDLQHLVNKYIELFVLCKNCHLPETHYKIKGDSISQKCVACGSKDLCDMTHKLTTFILKQHKKTKIEKDGGKKEDKKEKKKDKKHRGDETTAAATSTDDVDDDEKNKKKEKKSKKKKSSSAAVEEEEVIDETIEGDTERDALDAALDQFRVWLSSHSDMLDLILSSSPLKAQKLLQFLEELRSTQTLSCLSPAYRYVILFGTIFTIQCLIDHEIPRYKDILSSLISKQNQIQQRQLIAAVEWFVGIRFPSLVSRFPVVLKQLYDEDLIEEEVLIDWYHDDLRNEYSIDGSIITNEILEMLKESSKPFIIWLQEADEEGDEEEEEEEGGEGEEEN